MGHSESKRSFLRSRSQVLVVQHQHGGGGSFAKLFVKLNLSLAVAAPPNIDCCKYFIVFKEGEDDDDKDYKVFF